MQVTKIFSVRNLAVLRFCALVTIPLMFIMINFSFSTTRASWRLYQADPAAREAILQQRVVGYSLLQDLKNLGFKKIYNNGLEGSLYYSTQPLYGDHFGEWRYREYLWMPAEQVAQRLRDSGFDAIVVNLQLSADFPEQPGFKCHFRFVKEGDRAALFEVRKEPCRNDVHH